MDKVGSVWLILLKSMVFFNGSVHLQPFSFRYCDKQQTKSGAYTKRKHKGQKEPLIVL